MFRFLCQILFWIFPWFIRRRCLTWAYGYHIDSTAHIGFSIILAKKLWMEANSSIGHLCICKKIDRLELHESASMGNFNKITGFPTNDSSVIHFHHVKDRTLRCSIKLTYHLILKQFRLQWWNQNWSILSNCRIRNSIHDS